MAIDMRQLLTPWQTCNNNQPPATLCRGHKKRKMEVTVEIYNSVGEMLRTMEARPFTETAKKYGYVARGWINNTRNKNLLLNGDTKTAAKIKAGINKIKIFGNGTRTTNEVICDFCGGMPNVGAFACGDPRNMLNIKSNIIKNTKVINIAYDSTNFRGSDDKKVLNTSCMFLSALATLEKSGYRVNLYCVNAVKNRADQVYIIALQVKNSGKNLDMLRCAYPVANPDFVCLFYEMLDRQENYRLFRPNKGKNKTPYCYLLPVETQEKILKDKIKNFITIRMCDIYGEYTTISEMITYIKSRLN